MMDARIHRYEKLEIALRAIAKFNNLESPYKGHSMGILMKAVSRAIEDCPGFIDSTIFEYCTEIVESRHISKEDINKIKDLAKEALNEIGYEKRTGNDLYPCIVI